MYEIGNYAVLVHVDIDGSGNYTALLTFRRCDELQHPVERSDRPAWVHRLHASFVDESDALRAGFVHARQLVRRGKVEYSLELVGRQSLIALH